jgi:hypothetical protein
MDRWTQYFYEQHSEKELKNWASRLSMFRYFRAYGGHANDGDSLDLALRYNDIDELVLLIDRLGVAPTIYKEKPDQPMPGKSYPGDVFSSFPSLIEGTEWIEQLGHCEIFGVKVFIWCGAGLITISASPKSYVVTSEHVKAAEELEKSLDFLQGAVVDPPKDTKHYVCPKYHSNLFS